MRAKLFKFIWRLLWPIRLYLRFFPLQRGKGILLRYLVIPLLPPKGSEFDLSLPGGSVVRVAYRETLGLSSLLYGTFEKSELEFVAEYLRPGDMVIDIGANIGFFSAVMGRAIGKTGRVFAFDPIPENISRLKANMERNNIFTVAAYELALGSVNQEMELKIPVDTAYATLQTGECGSHSGKISLVNVKKLDDVWNDWGRPMISFIKMDVEGAELEIIKGSVEMLTQCRPTMLIEANTPQHLTRLKEVLQHYGYRHLRPDGFLQHNHLFICPWQV